MSEELVQYLKKINYDKQYKRLMSKLKGKSVIIYGAGQLFQLINERYDLSSLNIIGVSDKKYTPEDEGQDFLGYKIIPYNRIMDYKPDYVAVATLNYLNIIESLVCEVFDKTKTKVIPLAKKPLLTLLKEIWAA